MGKNREWTVCGFGHADGDDNHFKRVVLATFENGEDAIAACHNNLHSLEAAYENAGGDVEFIEYGVQHNGADLRIH
jgi:hypothetical protein